MIISPHIRQLLNSGYLAVHIRVWRIVLFFCLLPHLLYCQSASTRPLIIDSSSYFGELDTGIIDLAPYLGYYLENGESLNIEAVAKRLENPNFQFYSPDLLPNKKGDVYWLHLQLHNQMDRAAELSLYSFADENILFTVREGEISRMDTSGVKFPISTWPAMRDVPAIFDPYSIPVALPPNSIIDLYLRVIPHFYYKYDEYSTNLYSKHSYLKYDIYYINLYIRWQSLYQGMFLMILLFNLLIYFNSRDLTYLFYSLYVASIAYYFLVVMGYDRLWLWGKNMPFMPIGQNLSVYGVGVFYSLFCIYFLHKDGWRPKIRRWLMYFVYFALVSGIVSSTVLWTMSPLDTLTNYWMNVMFIPAGVIGTALFLYFNVIYLVSKNRLAKYFAGAGLIMFVGIFLSVLSSILQSLNLVSTFGLDFLLNLPIALIFEVACVIQILFFALALSYRARLIEKEKTMLEELDNTKTRFFSNISHEFKTPLTLILGPASDLLKKSRDSQSAQMLKVIQQNARRLLGLINEIMDLSKLDSGKMPLNVEKEDFVAFARKLMEQFQSYAESKAQQLQFESTHEQLIMGFDKDKMEKVLINLLSNACKFTPEGGIVTVKITTEKRDGRLMASVLIRDTGIGIKQDHLPHLFDRFYQANQKDYTTDQPSTGIGLALSRELVELHNGKIEVSSQIKKGTDFVFWLPLDLEVNTQSEVEEEVADRMEPDTPVLKSNRMEGPPEDSPEILLIEDNSELRAYIRSCLNEQYKIREAANGEEGLALAIQTIPTLVITDVMMPKKDGFQLSRELKENEKTSHIPIIILTGKSSQKSKLEGLETHADVYLSKPFDADELRLQVRNLLRNRRRMQEFYSRRILLETSEVEVSSQEEVFLQKAIGVIEENIGNEDFSIEDFSQALMMDRTQLFRKLKALTDQSPSIFIRNLRLKRARQMLEGNAGTVAEIAFAVGFRSTTYFNKCFKELYGDSPGKLKN